MVTPQFSSLLKQERERRGWTQKVLAETVGVTRVTVSRWESGVTIPPLYARRKICTLFNKTMEELFSIDYMSPTMNHVSLTSPEELSRSRMVETIETTGFPAVNRVSEEQASWPIRLEDNSSVDDIYQNAQIENGVQDADKGNVTQQHLATKYPHTLLATLGGQPEVVTFTLDLLLRRGFPISEVAVIHPAASPALQESLKRLSAEFIGDRYQYDGRTITCHLHSKVLEVDRLPLDDITNSVSVNGTRETVYRFIQQLKQQPRHIHLSITGGRRLMGLMAISAAQLKFDPFDHIWDIYTPEPIKNVARGGQLMHLPPEAGVTLLEVPFIPL